MNEMVNALRRELAQLEAELRADPRYVKIDGIKNLLAIYQKEAPPANLQQAAPAAEARARPRVQLKSGPKARDIKTAVTELLAANGSVHRKAILDHLIGKGLMGHEKNPLKQLAAYLSGWRAEFKSDGLGNFSLVSRREPAGSGLPFNDLGSRH